MAMVNIPVEAPMTEYLHAKASRLHIPLSGTFELTPVCNMACRMCYVRMTKAQQEALHPLRTAEEWLELGKTAKDRGMEGPVQGMRSNGADRERGLFQSAGIPLQDGS